MRKVFLFISVVLLSCSTLYAGEVFTSLVWGFSINKPDGWVEVKADDAISNVKRFDFSEAELKKIIDEQKSKLIFAASKRDLKSSSGAIPMVKINVVATNISDQNVFLQSLKASIRSTTSILDNVVVEQQPSMVTINGIKLVLSVISFDLKYDGKVCRARTYIYAALRKGYFLQFNFADSGKEEDCSTLFKYLASSITIHKK